MHLVGAKQAAVTGMGEPKSARVLATGEPVEWRRGRDGQTAFALRWRQCTEGDDVVVMEWE